MEFCPFCWNFEDGFLKVVTRHEKLFFVENHTTIDKLANFEIALKAQKLFKKNKV